MLSCTKHVYTLLLHFLRLSCSHSFRSLRHPSLGLSNSSITLRLNPSSQEDTRFSGRCTLVYNFHFILRHPSLGLNKISLTFWQRAQPFLSGRCPFFRELHLGIKFLLHPASSLFETQQQLTHPPVKSSTLPFSTNHVS